MTATVSYIKKFNLPSIDQISNKNLIITALGALAVLGGVGIAARYLMQPYQGKDEWDYRLFLTTNEKGQEATLDRLSKEPRSGNTIMGVSGFFVFNAAAARTQPDDLSILLVDCSKRVEFFWKNILPKLQRANDRIDAMTCICNELTSNANRYYHPEEVSKFTAVNGQIQEAKPEDPKQERLTPDLFVRGSVIPSLMNEVRNGSSWLSTDEKFKKIQKIFNEKRFHFKLIDLLNPKSAQELKEFAKKHQLTIDTLYFSNVFSPIYNYATSEESLQNRHALIQELSSRGTIIIEANDLERNQTIYIK